METVWFIIVAVMLTAYVVLDGFDLGAGVIYLTVARTSEERRMVLRSIGPVWDGNEVWLLAAGGTLYFAFPQLYATAFSGFYLPLMIVLWLLMLRAIGIEFRAHINNPVWQSFFDAIFFLSSALLIIFFGAALGNVIRGVPIGPDGYFFEPLWTDFKLGAHPGILDWYTVMSGVVALVTLTVHGALYVAIKTDGDLSRRARGVAVVLWPAQFFLTCFSLVMTYFARPHLMNNYADLSRRRPDPHRGLRQSRPDHLDGPERQRQTGLPGLYALHRRHAGRRSVRALSGCTSGQHRSRIRSHHL